MAEQVLPQHRPLEQLRTESAAPHEHSDKYVSSFETNKNFVDISFTNPILTKSADHFKVGVDELTVNLGSISMLDYGANDVLFRVMRRSTGDGVATARADLYMPDGPGGAADEVFREGLAFTIDRPYTSLQEIMTRMRAISKAVDEYVHSHSLAGGATNLDAVWVPANANLLTTAAWDGISFIAIQINASGQIQFSGNGIFWSNFVIEVPVQKYRSALLNDKDLRYISLHPITGALRIPFVVNEVNDTLTPMAIEDFGNPAGAFNQAAFDTLLDVPVARRLETQFFGSPNLLHTLDRRVTVEVGCSLPLKNSPFVDHGQESPDYVLGRYMFQKPYEVGVSGYHADILEIKNSHLGVQQLQGPKDRVQYHHLQAQQKIVILRLKLWIRVRSYDDTLDKWGMKTLECPVLGTDYWHIRLHFKEKDGSR